MVVLCEGPSLKTGASRAGLCKREAQGRKRGKGGRQGRRTERAGGQEGGNGREGAAPAG